MQKDWLSCRPAMQEVEETQRERTLAGMCLRQKGCQAPAGKVAGWLQRFRKQKAQVVPAALVARQVRAERGKRQERRLLPAGKFLRRSEAPQAGRFRMR